MTVCPTRTASESPRTATGYPAPSTRNKATSKNGSEETTLAGNSAPSCVTTVNKASGSPTTCRLVTINPSEETKNPVPPPVTYGVRFEDSRLMTTLTTVGRTWSTMDTTASSPSMERTEADAAGRAVPTPHASNAVSVPRHAPAMSDAAIAPEVAPINAENAMVATMVVCALVTAGAADFLRVGIGPPKSLPV